MVRIEGARVLDASIMTFPVSTPLFCEDGHRDDALNTVFFNVDTFQYEIITGDTWWFCDLCKPCGDNDCYLRDYPCVQCEKGYRSDLSRENGRKALDHEVMRILVGGC